MKRMIQKYFGRYTSMLIVGVIYLLPLVFVHGAAVDYFLKIEGVPGESTDAKHKGWIEIESFSWGMSQRITGSGTNRVVSPVDKGDLVVSKWIDKSSPMLMLATCSGIIYPNVELSIANKASTNSTSYLKIKLTDILVSSFQAAPGGGSSGSEALPMESISLNYTKIKFDYYEEDNATGFATNSVSVDCEADAGGGSL